MYSACEKEDLLEKIVTSLPYYYINKFIYKKCGGQNRMPIKHLLFNLIKHQIDTEEAYIIHFAGGYWREDLYNKCCNELGNFS